MTYAHIGTETAEISGDPGASCRTSSAPAGDIPKHLTAAEAADILRISPWQAVKLCRTGVLPATKPGKSWLITEAALLDYLDAHSNERAAS